MTARPCTRRSAWRLLVLVLGLVAVAGPAAARHVNQVVIDGSINPASADYLIKALDQSVADGAEALVVQLDTPGGLLAATKDIVQAILNARIPVIVWVGPKGGAAASAGTFITLAAHVAAMAPATSIGAASPISASGGGERDDESGERSTVAEQKAEKFTVAFIESIAKERDRNVEWAAKAVREAEAINEDEALELNVIDLVAETIPDLLDAVDGREVRVLGKPVTLATAGVEIRVIQMALMTRLFNFLASPDIAVLLVLAGMLGLYIEMNQPGLLVPGIAGAVCLVLAAIAFQILPFDWVGLLLMVVGLGLFAAEAFVTSYGLLFALGLACFLLGGSMVFDMPETSDLTISFWSVLVPAATAFAVIGIAIVTVVGRTFGLKQASGVGELIGMVGRSETGLAPEGRVFVRGEYWNATSDVEIPAGSSVEVVDVEGMRLRVRPAQDA